MDRLRVSQQLAVVVAIASLAGGCVHVHPYERGILARPDMQTADPAGPAERHVLEVHEGATGGGDFAESGCGCN